MADIILIMKDETIFDSRISRKVTLLMLMKIDEKSEEKVLFINCEKKECKLLSKRGTPVHFLYIGDVKIQHIQNFHSFYGKFHPVKGSEDIAQISRVSIFAPE